MTLHPWMRIAAGIGLALWILVPLFGIVVPPRRRDPQRSMAVGCLIGAMIPGIVLSVLYLLGIVFDLRWLLLIIFYVVALPMVLIVIVLVRHVILTLFARP